MANPLRYDWMYYRGQRPKLGRRRPARRPAPPPPPPPPLSQTEGKGINSQPRRAKSSIIG
jgi:hypothetical protein